MVFVAVMGVFMAPLAAAVVSDGRVVTVAGTGTGGFAGDGGPAVEALLGGPGGLALDRSGLLIADVANHVVRRVAPSGIIDTVAGTGVGGLAGDGGPATEALFRGPRDVAVRPAGHVVIADTGNHVVRVIDTDGIVRTIAGTGVEGGAGDGGPAELAMLSNPNGVAVRPNGSVVIADTGNHRVRIVDHHGIISTVAGGERPGDSGDGGPAAYALLARPEGVAVLPNGTIYVADTGNHRVRRIDVHGVITTVAGTGLPGYDGDHGPAISATLRSPSRVSVTGDGGLLIADTGNHVIRHVDADGTITTVVGTGQPGEDADGAPARETRLRAPRGVVEDGGLVVFADSGNDRVRTIVPDPVPPTLTSVSPTGPANDNRPRVLGEAVSGTTVRLYADPGCTGPVVATGSAQALAGDGIAVEVADDTVTTVHGTSVAAHGLESPCSETSVTYVEDSTPPAAPRLTARPRSPSASAEPAWEFMREGATTRCDLEDEQGTTVAVDGDCHSPWQVSLAGHPDGAYRLTLRAVDVAGNASVPTRATHVRDTTPPAAPSIELATTIDGDAHELAWTFTIEDEATATCRFSGPSDATVWTSCSSPWRTTVIDPGTASWELTVRATDIAGNTGPAASVAYVTPPEPKPPASPTVEPEPSATTVDPPTDDPDTQPTEDAEPAVLGPRSRPPGPVASPTPPAPAPPPPVDGGSDPVLANNASDRVPARGGFLATAGQLIVEHSDAAAWPLGLLLLVLLFLAIQDQLDRRDPKLAMAPLVAPDFSFPDQPTPAPRTLSRPWVARHPPDWGRR